MNLDNNFDRIRRWVAVISGTLLATGTWGFVAAMLVKSMFGLSENDSLLFVGLPVAFVMGVWLWPKMPKIMGWEK